jgi:hypothetical protein
MSVIKKKVSASLARGPQGFNSDEQSRARSNIGASSSEEVLQNIAIQGPVGEHAFIKEVRKSADGSKIEVEGGLPVTEIAADPESGSFSDMEVPSSKAVADYVRNNASSSSDVNNAINNKLSELSLQEKGGNGKFIDSVKQENGKVTATEKSFIGDIGNASGDDLDVAPSTSAVKDYVDDVIEDIDSSDSPYGGEGKYIKKVWTEGGLVKAEEESLVNVINSSSSADDNKAVSVAGVKDFVSHLEEDEDTSAKHITRIQQTNGKVEVTTENLVTDIENAPDNTVTPSTTEAVKNYVGTRYIYKGYAGVTYTYNEDDEVTGVTTQNAYVTDPREGYVIRLSGSDVTCLDEYHKRASAVEGKYYFVYSYNSTLQYLETSENECIWWNEGTHQWCTFSHQSLNDYYNKTEVNSKFTEVDVAIAAIQEQIESLKLKSFEVVAPTDWTGNPDDYDNGVLYLVGPQDSASGLEDRYKEYLKVLTSTNPDTYIMLCIGDTSVNLTGYVKSLSFTAAPETGLEFTPGTVDNNGNLDVAVALNNTTNAAWGVFSERSGVTTSITSSETVIPLTKLLGTLSVDGNNRVVCSSGIYIVVATLNLSVDTPVAELWYLDFTITGATTAMQTICFDASYTGARTVTVTAIVQSEGYISIKGTAPSGKTVKIDDVSRITVGKLAAQVSIDTNQIRAVDAVPSQGEAGVFYAIIGD